MVLPAVSSFAELVPTAGKAKLVAYWGFSTEGLGALDILKGTLRLQEARPHFSEPLSLAYLR